MVNYFVNFLLCTHLALYLHNTGGGSAKKKINPSALLFALHSPCTIFASKNDFVKPKDQRELARFGLARNRTFKNLF